MGHPGLSAHLPRKWSERLTSGSRKKAGILESTKPAVWPWANDFASLSPDELIFILYKWDQKVFIYVNHAGSYIEMFYESRLWNPKDRTDWTSLCLQVFLKNRSNVKINKRMKRKL